MKEHFGRFISDTALNVIIICETFRFCECELHIFLVVYTVAIMNRNLQSINCCNVNFELFFVDYHLYLNVVDA